MSTPALRLAGTYRRTVRASLARVWENVLDWEHLPSLHSGTFKAVELLDRTPSGWRIRVVNQPGGPERTQILALTTNKRAGKYRVTTIAGTGIGSEIHTTLIARAADRTAIIVGFHVPERDPGRLGKIGAGYRTIYRQLWDEDEVMMRGRERALNEKRGQRRLGAQPMMIGTLAQVRAKLPLSVDFAGRKFRIVELDGKLLAHSAICPHWLGPLDEAPLEDGCIRCPWHGYRFDVLSGRGVDGHNLKLEKAPRVTIVDGDVVLTS